MEGKNSKWLIPGTAFVIIILVIIWLGRDFVSGTQKDVDEQNRQYLTELAIQSAQAIKNTVSMQLENIESIANIIGNQDEFSMDYTMSVLDAEFHSSNFKRLAYIPPDGYAVSTDSEVFSVQDREYYHKALNGESNVSDVIVDKIGGGYINVYAVPLYHAEKLTGVIIATNETDLFSEILNFRTFYGEGYSYIIQKDGTPVVFSAGKADFRQFDNLFAELDKSGVEESEIAQMKQDMEQNDDGIIEYSMDDVPTVGAYRKIGINDWYVVTVVPRASVYENTDRIVVRNRQMAMITTVLLTALCVLIVLQNYKSDKKLSYLAYVDSFTGGNNLNRFKMLAARRIEKGVDSLYMVWVDIDNFKLINDMYGYQEGDAILLDMNRMISEIISTDDIYGRMSNDNFLCLVCCKDDEEVRNRDACFRERFREQQNNRGKRYNVIFTTGVYKITPDETDIGKIIDRTTMAHRRAKQMNSECKICFYNDTMREEAVRIKDIEDVMHGALSRKEFQVYLQPKCNMNTGAIEGAEALVRWMRDGRVMYPSDFIPVFERNGFIVNLDLYTLEEVCRMQRYWLDMGFNPPAVSVNQSKPLVYGKDYVQKVLNIVRRYDLPPNLIEIELLESLIHDNIDALQKITEELGQNGILVCIDDFGSGYSSLNLIKDICADVLKIDRAFLNNAETNQRAWIVLKNVVELAKGLNMSVVVEGVETENQAALLKEVGCTTAQGYLYAKPMPVSEYEKRIKNNREQNE
ncbi:EAL domain-containing protein [Faecalicatena orotica]|uniref:Diguanylate cyclase/phosphodiesterase n=1 Tax=Faecalicatena orotica TaxID=1544 RepID=A0A2Y9BGW5_9FIRM|nr:EAL domain-containing protein [Faecalicatena orotica]PWJ29808.1 diguanylate cyclase/phosphodiesterase [Faecalicatena orotica]SSA55533.1 diguanylate cyclase/phosphodiesterase [Faecalicatena orotica]